MPCYVACMYNGILHLPVYYFFPFYSKDDELRMEDMYKRSVQEVDSLKDKLGVLDLMKIKPKSSCISMAVQHSGKKGIR